MADKQRHGCLTAYLIFMIIANSASSLMYIFGSAAISEALPDMPGWSFPVLIFFGLFNVVCAVALFKFKKWGFWGFCVTAGIVGCVNIMIGIGFGSVLGGLMGVAILYGVLNIGSENKGWPQLD